jgi:hypothetical protein
VRRRDFIALGLEFCRPREAVLMWVGGLQGWRPRRTLTDGDLIRPAGVLRARVVTAHGWHGFLNGCLTHHEDWGQYCMRTFRGDGWVMPSTSKAGRATIDVVGDVQNAHRFPGRVRYLRVPKKEWTSFQCAPYAVRILR